MMVVDYLIANEDRHQNNFGVIRDVKNLILLAPLLFLIAGHRFGLINQHR